MDDKEKEEEKKNIDVVSGDGSEINISPVYDHIILDKPNINEKKEQIVIPKGIKENNKEDENEEKDNNGQDSNTKTDSDSNT